MKKKNAYTGLMVSAKKDTYDVISMYTFLAGGIYFIDAVSRHTPEVRLANAGGTYLGWLNLRDVRRVR